MLLCWSEVMYQPRKTLAYRGFYSVFPLEVMVKDGYV